MRKQHVYYSKDIRSYRDTLEHNQYGYTVNFVRWFYNKITSNVSTYKNVIIKRRHPSGGCVERTSESFDIAATKETWNESLVDYAKELGTKLLDEHPNGVIKNDRFGNLSYTTTFPYGNTRGYIECIETVLFNNGYYVDADSPDTFDVILSMVKQLKTPILIDNKHYFFYNRHM